MQHASTHSRSPKSASVSRPSAGAQPQAVALSSSQDAEMVLDTDDSEMEELENELTELNSTIPPRIRYTTSWSSARFSDKEVYERPVRPHNNLITDQVRSGFRVIFTKLFVVYRPEPPRDAALLGFKINFHPITDRRIVHCETSLRFYITGVGEFDKDIEITAVHPETFVDRESSTEVEESSTSSAALNLGYEPWASGQLQYSTQTSLKYQTSARMLLSGVYTDTAWLTVEEDPSSNRGLPPSSQFALLLRLPASKVPFAAEMKMKIKTVSSKFEAFSGKTHTLSRTLLFDGAQDLSPEVQVGSGNLGPQSIGSGA